MTSDIERAELIQSIKAYLIPTSLFLSVIVNSAGGFLVYNGYSVGWVLVAIGTTAIVSAFVAFIRFQNRLRAKGQFSSSEAAKYTVSTDFTLDDELMQKTTVEPEIVVNPTVNSTEAIH